jgi:YVTN family beta-propeller protein
MTSSILGRLQAGPVQLLSFRSPAELLFSLRARKYRAVSVALVLASFLAGCGGSTAPVGGGGGGGAQTPDFSLTLSASSLTLPSAGSGSVSISVTGSNGFMGSVSVQPSGMTSGITVSPSSAQVSAGGSGTSFTVTASSSAATGNSTITFTATSGSLSHSAQLTLTLQAPPATSALGRTKYVRTDSATDYGVALNEGWTVYDSATRRFYVTDTSENLLHVIDATTEKQIATIPVPGVYGIDITPDNSTIYAGTQIGDVYAIDPVKMTVTHRYMAAQIGAYGYQAYAVHVLANGSLVLLGGQGGIPSVDGYLSFGIWNVTTNSLQLYTTGYGMGVGFSLGGSLYSATDVCPSGGAIGGFLLSGDRQRVILSSIDSDSTICSFDPVSGNSNAVTGAQEFIYHLAATPDGSSILTTGSNPSRIIVLDSKTLTQKSAFNVSADTSSAGNLFVSPDSSTVYLTSGGQVFAYDVSSGAMKGWTPAPVVTSSYGGLSTGPSDVPTLSAMDETGLIAGPMEEGVGFVDTTTMRTGSVGSSFGNAYLSPATGPVSGGTATVWTAYTTNSPTISSVDFGANAATAVSKDSAGIHATTPAGTAGPVDVYAFASDGGVQIVPEAFSYGPTILEATPDSSTAEGGGTGIIYGYGFGPAGTSTAPSDLQVSVGGHAATITSFTSNAYGLTSPPFLLEAIAFNLPPGVAGTSADISVTTSSGSTTLAGGMHYLPAIQQFPLSGASLAQGIYDSHRDLFYFSDTNSIRVFSRTNQTWMPSMTVTGTGHRLWAMSLSPDGSKLVVSDPPTGSIYLFDPTGTSPPRSFPLNPATTSYPVEPGGLVVTDSGVVYFGRAVIGLFGASSLARLDLSTGTVTVFQSVGSSGSNSDVNFHLALSNDNSRAYFNDQGQMLYVDTASNTVVYKPVGDGCCYGDYDLHLANNQSSIEATSFLYDGDANGQAGLALNLREAMNIQYVDGTAFSPDGSLLFQPSTNAIDVFDGRLFTLRTRIALPVTLGQNYDALVAGGPDDQLLAITGAAGTGIALIDLTGLSEPNPLPYVTSAMSTWEPAVRLNGSTPAGAAHIPAFRVPHRSLLPGQRPLPPEQFHFSEAPAPLARPASQSDESVNGRAVR